MIEWIAEHKALSVLGVLFSGIGTTFIVYLFKKFRNQQPTIIVNVDSKSDDIVVKIGETTVIIKKGLSSSSP